MRGKVHSIKLYGLRQTGGASPTFEPVRDSEGRFVRSPTNPPHNVAVTSVTGFIGYPRRDEVDTSETVDNAAQLPPGTVVNRGDELEAYGIAAPDDNLNGRYTITGVSYGRAMVRVLLRRFTA